MFLTWQEARKAHLGCERTELLNVASADNQGSGALLYSSPFSTSLSHILTPAVPQTEPTPGFSLGSYRSQEHMS